MVFFNPFRPSYIEDPYPALARLRAQQPVFFSQEIGAWLVTRYEDCARVLHDDATFRSDYWRIDDPRWTKGRARTDLLLGGAHALSALDPEEHRRKRGIVSDPFTPRVVASLRPVVEAEVDRLLGGMHPGVPFDVMGDLAHPLPRTVIAEALGIPEADRGVVMAHVDTVARAIFRDTDAEEWRGAVEARDALLAYLSRADLPAVADGMVGFLLAAAGMSTLTGVEVAALTIDVAMAGNDPTACLIGNGLVALLRHPEQASLLRADPSLIAPAVDELIRFDSPIQAVLRVATIDTALNGRAIRENDLVYLMLGAANRDPAQFPMPEVLDVRREERRHLGFGAGPHFCLGAPLARLEAEVVFARVLERFPALRLAPRGIEREPEFEVRGPKRLLVIAE